MYVYLKVSLIRLDRVRTAQRDTRIVCAGTEASAKDLNPIFVADASRYADI